MGGAAIAWTGDDGADSLEKLQADELVFARDRRPPDLQALVEKYAPPGYKGGYDRIPPDVMAAFTASVDAWRRRLLAGEFAEMEFRLAQRRRQLGAPESGVNASPPDDRHSSFKVYRDSDGILRRENIEDALVRLDESSPR